MDQSGPVVAGDSYLIENFLRHIGLMVVWLLLSVSARLRNLKCPTKNEPLESGFRENDIRRYLIGGVNISHTPVNPQLVVKDSEDKPKLVGIDRRS